MVSNIKAQLVFSQNSAILNGYSLTQAYGRKGGTNSPIISWAEKDKWTHSSKKRPTQRLPMIYRQGNTMTAYRNSYATCFRRLLPT